MSAMTVDEIETIPGTFHAAIVAALGELTNPIASETANMGTFQSKYANLPSCLDLVRAVFARHELAISQPVYTHDDSLVVETLVRHVSGNVLGSGPLIVRMPPNPQQTGSTITYLRRYQLCALLGIAASEDDDDGKAASTAPPKRATTRRKSDDEQQQQPTRRAAAAITDMQRRHIMAMFNSLGLSGDENRTARLAYTSNAIGREIETTNDITRDEAKTLIETLIVDTNEAHEGDS